MHGGPLSAALSELPCHPSGEGHDPCNKIHTSSIEWGWLGCVCIVGGGNEHEECEKDGRHGKERVYVRTKNGEEICGEFNAVVRGCICIEL